MSKLIKISLIILSLAFGHNIYAKGITEVVDHCNKSYRIGYEITDTGVVRKKPCITVSRGTATIIGHAAQTSSCRCRILNYKINKNKTRRQTTFDMYTSAHKHKDVVRTSDNVVLIMNKRIVVNENKNAMQ